MTLPPKRTGSGYVNLGKYLNANKNSGVGNAVQNGVQNNVNQFKSGLTSAQNDFQHDVSGSALDTDPNKAIRQEVLSKIGTLGSKDQVAGVGDKNTSKVISQGDVDQFGKFNAGAYGGPQDIASGAQLLGQSQNLQNIGNATRTEAGRQGLLQQYAGGNQYTQGQQKLDSLLLGHQANKLGAVNRSVQGLENNTLNQLGQARDLANIQAKKNYDFGQESQKLVNDPLNKNLSDISGAVSKFNADRTTDYSALTDNLNNLKLSGYDPSLAGKYTFGANPNDPRFVSQGREANAGNVMTAQQEAQMNALSRLAGKDPMSLPSFVEGDRYDPTKAATFNSGAYKQARDQAEASYRQEQAPLISEANQLSAFIANAQKDKSQLTNIADQKARLNEISNLLQAINTKYSVGTSRLK